MATKHDWNYILGVTDSPIPEPTVSAEPVRQVLERLLSCGKTVLLIGDITAYMPVDYEQLAERVYLLNADSSATAEYVLFDYAGRLWLKRLL